MECKCDTINKIKHDIGVATGIRSTLKGYQDDSQLYSDACHGISNIVRDSLLHPITGMINKINTMNDSVTFTDLIGACNGFISDLTDLLSTLQTEDYAHHNAK